MYVGGCVSGSDRILHIRLLPLKYRGEKTYYTLCQELICITCHFYQYDDLFLRQTLSNEDIQIYIQ